jgi:hypothetical protein
LPTRKLSILLLAAIFFVAAIPIRQFIVPKIPLAWFYKAPKSKPGERELLLAELEKYAKVLYFDYPFVTGFIPELADYKGGTLPLKADDRFEDLTRSKKFSIMQNLTDFLHEAKSSLGIFSGKGHSYNNVIIETSAGRYYFSKSVNSLAVPSGEIFKKEDL